MIDEIDLETENEQIQSSEADTRKHAIAKALAELRIEPTSPSIIDLSCKDTVKLPLAQIASLGIGLSELPEAFRTAVTTIDPQTSAQLYRAILPQGATLRQAKDGLFSSSAVLGNGSPAWGKFEAVSPSMQSASMTIIMPIDPTMLVVAAALAQVNRKLDKIQGALNEMFNYLRIKDKANLLSSLETLQTILADYRYNLGNEQFKQESCRRAHSINADACQHINELRAHLQKETRKKKLIELRGQAHDATEAVLNTLRDYQLAVHLYAFSTFLDIIFLENYDRAYLESKIDNINKKALEYRKAYTDCFNELEVRADKALDKAAFDGVATGMQKLGHLLEKTPVGDIGLIDEKLAKAGSEIKVINQRKNDKIVEALIEAKDPAVEPFVQGIDTIDRVYNQPIQVAIDKQNIYLLPERQ